MKNFKILFTLIACSLPIYSTNSFNVAIDGNFNSVLFKSDYSIGLTPMYNWHLKEKYDLSLGIPLQYVGKKTGSDEYYESVQYISLGAQLSLYRTIYQNDWLCFSLGGDLFFNYGFPPTKTTKSFGSKTEEKIKRTIIGTAGLGLPVVLDCKLNKHMLLRFTQRIVELSADAYITTNGIDDHFNVFAGFDKRLTPTMSLLFTF